MAKASPWIRALCYPLGETSIVTRPGFCRTDLLKQLSRNPDDAGPEVRLSDYSVGGVLSTTPAQAVDRGVIKSARNLRWWELIDPYAGTEVAGYTVAPYLVPRNNRMPDWVGIDGVQDPLPVQWEAVSGGNLHKIMLAFEKSHEEGGEEGVEWRLLDGMYWVTCRPDAEPQADAIAWRGTDRREEYLAKTTLPLPAGQSWALRLWWVGTAPVFRDATPLTATGPGGTATVDLSEEVNPYVQVVWGGGTWCVNFTLGRPPMLCRWVNGAWQIERTFEDFNTDLFADHEPMWLRAFNIAGRLVVQIETAGGKSSQVVYTATAPDRFGQPEIAPVSVPKGALLIGGRGVAFSAQLSEYRFGQWVPEERDVWGGVTPAHFDGDGSFQREYWCNRSVNEAAIASSAFGYYPDGNPARAGGLYEGDASQVATVTDEALYERRGHATVRSGKRRYTCTLSAHNPELTREMLDEGHPYAMAGARTPFVYGVCVKVGSSKTATSTEPVDIRPAIERASESLADPALAAGPSWTLNINRSLLGEAVHQGTGNPIGSGWTDYVTRNHRINIDLSWVNEDGTVSAGEPPYGGAAASYVRRLIGFITAESPESGQFGDYSGTLQCRDFSVLLQAPAGLIDGRYAPLDFLLHEKLADGDRTLYGWEAVQDILAKALHPDIAATLVHEFPANHYDLLTHRMLLDPPSGGFFYPPPFGSDARQWIQQLCDRDFAVFFFAATVADATTVVPHYSNYYSHLEGAPTLTAYDARYVGVGTDDLLLGAGWQHDPRADINRVIAQGAPPGQMGLGGLMPALGAFSAEARIESGSPISEQNIADTWERTKLLTGAQYWLPHVARVVSVNFLRLLRGIDMRAVRLTVRGNPYLWWGWKVRPRMNAVASDPYGLRLHDQLCRIMRLQNVVDLKHGRYETELRVVPEPNLEG